MTNLDGYALVVVDVQRGFDDPARGPSDNPSCDENIDRLIQAWAALARPIVYVRHDSQVPGSSLHPDHPGNRFKEYLSKATPDLLVTKQVNSAFHGTPDLHAWLGETGARGVVICGITTNHCCETTARVGSNLGHPMVFVLDATHTFDLEAVDGTVVTARELSRVTGANLHGEFGDVLSTDEVLARSSTSGPGESLRRE